MIYHNILEVVLKGCQMILFEAYDDAGTFITSDNPAFENKIFGETKNSNGMLFPLSPKYLIFIAKGSEGINVIDHRFANANTIRYLNRIVARYKNKTIIAVSKHLSDSLYGTFDNDGHFWQVCFGVRQWLFINIKNS